jgi:hypothetical protein
MGVLKNRDTDILEAEQYYITNEIPVSEKIHF